MTSRTTRRILGLLGVTICATLVSCLPFPVGDPAKSAVDPKLAGYWLTEDKDGGGMLALVAPFDERAYVIHLAQSEANEAGPKMSHMVFKAWLTDVKGQKLLCCEVIQQILEGAKADDQREYPTFNLTLKDAALTSKILKSDFPAIKDAKNAAEMLKAIEANIDNEDMYADPTNWRRLDPQKDEDVIQKWMK